jgi:ABC-type Fe3+-hydroxamate transport system substrate-binding protein
MKILFAMILLMITATCGCATDNSSALEQTTSDVVEVGDITVEDVEVFSTSDVEDVLDDGDVVPTVEEDVEN